MAAAVFRMGNMFRNRFSAIALALSLVAAPAAAQFQSDGYKFLDAVKDRDGNVVTEALKEPGSVVVNTRDITTGETALHIVTSRRDTQWIKFLAQNGADPNIKDRKGVAPLQIAAVLGPPEAAEALIDAGARVDVATKTGETPLIAAVHNRDVAMVRMLLSKGASPDMRDNSGRSARDYLDLQTGNGLLLSEFKKADESREEKAKPESYGPIIW